MTDEADGCGLPERLFDSQMRSDPYSIYHQLRATDPVHWDEQLQAWVITRYRDVGTILHDPRFSADRVAFMRRVVNRAELAPFFDFIANRMVFTDPPKHTRLRGLLNRAFTPHAVEAMRPRIQQLVDGFIDKALPEGCMDVIRDLAFPLPTTVISLMLGIPPDDIGQLKAWSDEFVTFFGSSPAAITPEQYGRCASSAASRSRKARWFC